MILKLRTLTPLHVGDGSQLHSFDYVEHEGRFYRTSQRFFESFLDKIGGDAPQRFADWSGDIVDQMEQLETDRRRDPRSGKDYNQRMSALRKQHSLREFAKRINQERAFLDFLQQNIPSIPIQTPSKQEIRGFQRAADGQPYLPGSSVKGCIRTALMYHFLEHHERHENVRRILEESIEHVRREKATAGNRRFNPERHKKNFAEKLEHLAFFAGMVDERGRRRNSEAQDDLMRCVLVADTYVPLEHLGVENIDLYLVKKLPKGQGYEAQKQRQAPAAEAVLPGAVLQVHLDFNAELLLHLHRRPGDEGIRVGRETHFIGWRERAKALFNLTNADFSAVPDGARNDHPAVQALRDKALAHIIECCRTFSAAQAEALNHWKRHFQQHDHAGDLARGLDAGVAPVFSATGARLHLGFATGFEGMTMVLHLLAHHKPLFADIMELFGIGDSPSAWKTRSPGETYRANPDKFPNSRRLVSRPRAILPLGWLEWADDPKAGPAIAFSNTKSGGDSKSPPDLPPVAKPTPAGPKYLRGTLKTGAELDAELTGAGNPGRFKLFIRPDYEPEVEVKYPAGFKPEDIGRLAIIRVKNIRGKEEVTAVDFVRFK